VTDDKLKPCPFCGGEASILEPGRSVWCTKCAASCDSVGLWNRRDLGREAALVEAARRALSDFDGPVQELVNMANVHPFTKTPEELRAALSAYDEEGK
jgi:hypothetical protein